MAIETLHLHLRDSAPPLPDLILPFVEAFLAKQVQVDDSVAVFNLVATVLV